MAASGTAGVLRSTVIWPMLLVLVAVTLVFARIRVATDLPNVAAGTVPVEGSFDRRYALHPVLAYAHILPGVVYLVGAPLQLSRRFRERHFTAHRRMGRVLLPAGLTAGVFAVVFGSLYSYGGVLEATAAIAFGVFFILALLTAYRAIRRRDVARHRRWMIRAFAIGLAVGTIRFWIAIFQAAGLLSFRDSFGVAFWLSFVLHALAAEAYLSRFPGADGSRVPATVRRSRQ